MGVFSLASVSTRAKFDIILLMNSFGNEFEHLLFLLCCPMGTTPGLQGPLAGSFFGLERGQEGDRFFYLVQYFRHVTFAL